MIQLDRIRTAAAIDSSFVGATPRSRLFGLLEEFRDDVLTGAKSKVSIPSRWSDAKEQLLEESSQKCAYCETHTSVVAFGDVEHYRPKSVYWWLAYVLDNYLASCAVCNQRYKGALFEHTGPAMPAPPVALQSTDQELESMAQDLAPDPLDLAAVTAFESLHRAEGPLLPNPYVDHPENHFAWRVFKGIREVWLEARDTASEPIVDSSTRMVGLNRNELRRLRFRQWEVYDLSRRTADAPGIPADLAQEHLELVASMTLRDSQFAGMIRFFEEAHANGTVDDWVEA